MSKKTYKKIKKPKIQGKGFDHTHFLNREISWLEFNTRVLNEARDTRTPLVERFRFLSIYTSNLDEFVMKRVGGLKRQLTSEYTFISVDGLTTDVQLEKIRLWIQKEIVEQERIFHSLVAEAKKESIHLLEWSDLTSDEIQFCNKYFLNNIFPILTPLSVDPGKPFPFISNLSYSLGIYLEHPFLKDKIFSRVKVPQSVHMWISVGDKTDEFRMINTSEIIKNNLEHLFRGMKVIDIMPFRVTRNADWDHDDEDTEDLLELIEESINERRLQEPIRLEVLRDHNPEMLSYLLDELELGPNDVYTYENRLEYLNLGSIADLTIPRLKFKDWRPVTLAWFVPTVNLFEQIRLKDRIIHPPYDNFSTSVERFVRDAAKDPNVLSIKMTLYRTGENSKFIKALIAAAENGKQVVCLIELKARFDEKRNIYWAQKLEKAGVHVVYGIVGLKTHTKITLVVRKEVNGELLRYAHIGTGNYNSKTAKLYTDIGLLTVNAAITEEVNEVFNYLTGSSLKVDYSKLLVAPINAKSFFIKKIYEQIKRQKETGSAEIIAKMNSMEDVAISEALYEASNEGVKITLIVRGFCCVKPNVKGLSENIKVISVIGRFLEHSRIFYFSDGKGSWSGDYYIGSADWMHRNMHGRVEVMTPIEDLENQKQIAEFLDIILKDKRSSWILNSDGTYSQSQGDEKTSTHIAMMKATTNKIKLLEL